MPRDIVAEYAKKGGPVPTRATGSIAAAFWRAYDHGPDQPGLRGGHASSPAGRAFRAGLARRKVEPGLSAPTPTEQTRRA
jgi:hypothetical protein